MNAARLRRIVGAPARRFVRAIFARYGFTPFARAGLLFSKYAVARTQYQPLYGRSQRPVSQRDVDIRWHYIEPRLPPSGSALDIGCQNGWFTLAMADRGLYSLGVERAEHSVQTAQWLALHNGSTRAGFMCADVTPESVRALPTVDVVLCLSVFHHWVRHQDLEYATAVMRALSDRCRSHLFFESGQSDDPYYEWAGALDFMGNDPKEWLEAFLESLGFDNVSHLGDTQGHRGKGVRHFMLATRS